MIAAVVAAIGWFVQHWLTLRRDRAKERLEASLKYTERQLEEVYGPLAFLILEGRQTWRDLVRALGGRPPFTDGAPTPGTDTRVWLFWVENDFMPRNEKMKDLLATKTHLIEGAELPASYLRFLDHHNSWRMDHLRWTKERISYSWHSRENWPEEFETEVVETFRRIKQRHAGYLQKLQRRGRKQLT